MLNFVRTNQMVNEIIENLNFEAKIHTLPTNEIPLLPLLKVEEEFAPMSYNPFSEYQKERRETKEYLDLDIANALEYEAQRDWYHTRYERDAKASEILSKLIRSSMPSKITSKTFLPKLPFWSKISQESKPFINDRHFLRTSFNTERFEEMVASDEFGWYTQADYDDPRKAIEMKIRKSLEDLYKESDYAGLPTAQIIAMSEGTDLDMDIRNLCDKYSFAGQKQIAPLQPMGAKYKQSNSFKSVRDLATGSKCFDLNEVLRYKKVVDFFEWDFRTVRNVNQAFQKMQKRYPTTNLSELNINSWMSLGTRQQTAEYFISEFKANYNEVMGTPMDDLLRENPDAFTAPEKRVLALMAPENKRSYFQKLMKKKAWKKIWNDHLKRLKNIFLSSTSLFKIWSKKSWLQREKSRRNRLSCRCSNIDIGSSVYRMKGTTRLIQESARL
jgi:hypothetical protein